jgi:hypothetical protein
MAETPPLSPRHQAMCAGLSWALAIALAILAEKDRGFARFSVPLLPCSIVAWTIIYSAISGILMATKFGKQDIAGYPGASYMCSLVHGGFVLPSLFFCSAFLHAGETKTALSSSFYSGGWGTAVSTSLLLHEQIHCAVIGYLLKDFTRMALPDGLGSALVIHHVAAVAGCGMCLCIPAMVGVATLQAVQCELASALYSFSYVYPCWASKFFYLAAMALSNIIGIGLSFLVCTADALPLIPWRLVFAALSIVIIGIRVGGMVLEVKKVCESKTLKEA